MTESPAERIRPFQWQKGQSGNWAGPPKRIHEWHRANGERATSIRAALLVAVEQELAIAAEIGDADFRKQALQFIGPDVLRLIQDSENRAYGLPTQQVKIGGDGTPVGNIVSTMTPEEAAEIYSQSLEEDS